MRVGALVLLLAGTAAAAPFSHLERVAAAQNGTGVDLEGMQEWASRVAAGALQPDGWWLKTCAGWSALMLCGAVFGAGIDETTARAEDVGLLFGSAAESVVDYERRAVDTRCIWNFTETNPYTAIYRDHLGCTLVEGITEADLRAQHTGDVTPPPPLDPTVDWPIGEAGPTNEVPPGVDMDCVRERVAEQFADLEANPRGITVVFRERLIFEQYQEGVVDKDSRLIGWSATKSVVNGLIGVLQGDGLIQVRDPAPVPEWQGDERAAITTDEMLHMVSGVPWGFDPLTTTWCLFDSESTMGGVPTGLAGDCAAWCTNREDFPLLAEPGTRGEYNSGSSYILSRIVNQERGDPELSNFQWPAERLFWPIGAHSFYIEYQPNKHFLGGAMGYATARDWARYGLLFLRDGVWIDGRRILPEGWVEYSRTGSNADPGYGAHWRLDAGRDMFFATGFRNENVYVFPNLDLVITRHAMPQPIYFGWNQNQFLDGMLQCFDQSK